MGKRIPVTIGDVSFKTKKEAVAHIRRLIDECGVGVPADQDFFLALLALHPRAEHKIGPGARRVYVTENIVDPDGGYTLWVERVDGSQCKWGYRKCMNTRPPHNVYTACRQAIAMQMADYKLAHLAESGLAHEDAEVHHLTPFKQMVDDWRRGREDFEYTRGGDHGIGGAFADPELAASFCEYHERHARLRLVSVEEHRKLTYGDGT